MLYLSFEFHLPSPQNLDLLLKLIQEVPDKHSDTEVLETAAKTLELLCKEEYAIYSRCDIARSSLLDMIVNKYKEANDEYINLLDGVSGVSGCTVVSFTRRNHRLDFGLPAGLLWSELKDCMRIWL